jgi:sulfite exporter TauE/SafE
MRRLLANGMPVAPAQAMIASLEAGSVAGALILGLTMSPHCFLMCGPLACVAGGVEPVQLGRRTSSRRSAIAWQLGRLTGYAVIGALLGAVGVGLSRVLARSITPALPWVLAAALILGPLVWLLRPRSRKALPTAERGGLEPSQGSRSIDMRAQFLRLLRALRARFTGVPRAAILGAMTPLLPCGALWGLFAAEVTTGSWWLGALIGVAFAVAGVPALAAAQIFGARFTNGPRWSRIALRVAPLVAAGVLVWRALATTAHHSCH